MIQKYNAVVGQSGGPTAAINATLSGVVRGLRESGRVDKLFGMRNGVEGLLEGRTVDLFSLLPDEESLKLLEQTPAAALGSCRKRLPEPDDNEGSVVYDAIFGFLHQNNIKYFLYIGGNDSMDTVLKLDRAARIRGIDVSFIGVPKTIDNDLCATDHTPGYGSAAKYVACAMKEICRDCSVYTKKAVTIVEIMGRDAGWLTAAAALPSLYGDETCDLCYLPEIGFDEDSFVEKILEIQKHKPYVVVAVSEGLVDAGGKLIGEQAQSGAVDVFGHGYFSGTAHVLEDLVRNRIGCKVRSVEINILQRCAAHILSKCDIDESVAVGRYAALSALSGESGKMASFVRRKTRDYCSDLVLADIVEVANNSHYVPREYISEDGSFVTRECLEYIKPLIDGEVETVFENGLPKHFVIS